MPARTSLKPSLLHTVAWLLHLCCMHARRTANANNKPSKHHHLPDMTYEMTAKRVQRAQTRNNRKNTNKLVNPYMHVQPSLQNKACTNKADTNTLQTGPLLPKGRMSA